MRRQQRSCREERRDAAEKLAAATDEYEQLVAQADQLRFEHELKAASKLAKKAIELEPQRPEAYYALAAAYAASGDHLLACECCYSVMEREESDSRWWAQAVHYAWDSRRHAAPCGTYYLFCGCERCAALPEPRAWMATPHALVAMADRVVAALPGDAESWRMHASAHWDIESWPAASKSYVKAAGIYSDEGNEHGQAVNLQNAQAARENAEAEAKATAEAEAARMAAREAAANAAMEALLAEEEQEKAAAKSRKQGKVKGKGRRK